MYGAYVAITKTMVDYTFIIWLIFMEKWTIATEIYTNVTDQSIWWFYFIWLLVEVIWTHIS